MAEYEKRRQKLSIVEEFNPAEAEKLRSSGYMGVTKTPEEDAQEMARAREHLESRGIDASVPSQDQMQGNRDMGALGSGAQVSRADREAMLARMQERMAPGTGQMPERDAEWEGLSLDEQKRRLAEDRQSREDAQQQRFPGVRGQLRNGR